MKGRRRKGRGKIVEEEVKRLVKGRKEERRGKDCRGRGGRVVKKGRGGKEAETLWRNSESVVKRDRREGMDKDCIGLRGIVKGLLKGIGEKEWIKIVLD